MVVPAFNEAARIGRTLELLSAAAEALGIAEVVVVDDGSTDDTAAIVEAAAAGTRLPTIRLERHERNRGKGAALRSGAQVASGDYVAFLDADLSVPPETLAVALPLLRAGAGLVIGSRLTAGGGDMRESQPAHRRMLGKLFSQTRRRLVGLRFDDTQCPFKVMRSDVAARMLPLCRVDGWSFDVELLVVAMRLGVDVVEIPVEWRHVDGSTVSSSPATALRSLRELLAIRRRHGRAARTPSRE